MLCADVAAAFRPMPGETQCGDHVAVVSTAGVFTVVVADGLGHGPHAAEAAQAAVAHVTANPLADLATLLRDCDRALAGSRGAAVTVLRVDMVAHRLSYAGVGNVELRGETRLPVRPVNAVGIVGGRFRRVRASEHDLSPGDVLLLHTDGLSSRVDLRLGRDLPVTEAAQTLLDAGAKSHDDAACVLIRMRDVGSGESRA